MSAIPPPGRAAGCYRSTTGTHSPCKAVAEVTHPMNDFRPEGETSHHAGRSELPTIVQPPESTDPMIAFTFPGQGSQRPGMGAPWRDDPSWALVERASAVAGRDVAHLLLEADADELKLTHNAQLATFVLSLVVHDAAVRAGLRADAVAGHSLGEYSALVAAGAVGFDDGVRLVAERGDAMREACSAHTGTMAAVLGGEDADIEAACAEIRAAGGDVWVANLNAPGQIVIAGEPDALARAGEACKARGAKRVMPVAVSGAFHTPYMAPAQGRLDAALAATTFAAADVPVAANVDAALHRDAAAWQQLLSRQLCSPVRWSHLLGALDTEGVSTLIELGPGTVLSGMGKRTLEGAVTLAAATPAEVADLGTRIAQEEARVATENTAVEGEQLYAAERLVVSPAAGVFEPVDLADGTPIEVGDLVGRVGEHEVRARFAGWVMGHLAHRGERVTPRQPVAWMRIA